jgi:Retrotransposon gag protein
LLVEEVSARFKLTTVKHPVDEFKRLHQTSTLDEYVKKFSRVRARLLYYDPNLKEKFFIQAFISGLRDEIKHLMDILNLRKLNDAFNYAYKFELSLEG